jgi:hypothetical protein
MIFPPKPNPWSLAWFNISWNSALLSFAIPFTREFELLLRINFPYFDPAKSNLLWKIELEFMPALIMVCESCYIGRSIRFNRNGAFYPLCRVGDCFNTSGEYISVIVLGKGDISPACGLGYGDPRLWLPSLSFSGTYKVGASCSSWLALASKSGTATCNKSLKLNVAFIYGY